METMTLAKLCENVTMTAKQVDNNNPDWQDADAWQLRLRYQGRAMVVTFHQGYGHNGAEPDKQGVMDCLLSDASLCGGDFEDFCGETGDNTDSIKALKSYKQCLRQTKRLQALLGDDYEAFLYADRN